VVRSAHDRCLEDPSNGKLFATVRLSRSLGEFDLPLRARPGQAAREARLSISATAVTLRATQRPGHPAGSLPGIACTAVRVWEKNPPLGVKRLEWILLTDAAVEDFARAREVALQHATRWLREVALQYATRWLREVALQYATRWLMEEFHKALKTGLGAERLQLETAGRLFAAIAILSLVALRLIDFRERVRLSAAAGAEQSGLSELELAVLRARLERPIRTVGEVAPGVGRLGGHMNRKGDGWPGWQTLWKGMRELELLVQGVLLSQKVRRSQE